MSKEINTVINIKKFGINPELINMVLYYLQEDLSFLPEFHCKQKNEDHIQIHFCLSTNHQNNSSFKYLKNAEHAAQSFSHCFDWKVRDNGDTRKQHHVGRFPGTKVENLLTLTLLNFKTSFMTCSFCNSEKETKLIRSELYLNLHCDRCNVTKLVSHPSVKKCLRELKKMERLARKKDSSVLFQDLLDEFTEDVNTKNEFKIVDVAVRKLQEKNILLQNIIPLLWKFYSSKKLDKKENTKNVISMMINGYYPILKLAQMEILDSMIANRMILGCVEEEILETRHQEDDEDSLNKIFSILQLLISYELLEKEIVHRWVENDIKAIPYSNRMQYTEMEAICIGIIKYDLADNFFSKKDDEDNNTPLYQQEKKDDYAESTNSIEEEEESMGFEDEKRPESEDSFVVVGLSVRDDDWISIEIHQEE